MGQQQVLFVILAVCIMGIAISIGVISLSGHTVSDNRFLVEQDLREIAKRAQEYVSRPPDRVDFGNSSFAMISRRSDVLKAFGFPSSNSHGDFFVKRSHNPACLQIVGVGVEAGLDMKHPVRMMITVWTNRTSLEVLN